MSTAEFTITLHNTDKVQKSSKNETFYRFWIKFTAGTLILFTLFLAILFSIFATTRTEYIPSALILMTTLGIISYLLEKDGERNERN